MTDKILLYDIETSTDGVVDAQKDRMRVFGCYSYLTDKYYCMTDIKEIKKIIAAHDIVVGFNNLGYDNVVLRNSGIDCLYKEDYEEASIKYKVNIDLMQIFKKRASAMKIKEGMLGDLLMSFSLDYITKTLGLVTDEDSKIKGFDYSLLNKISWSETEWETIKEYTIRDLEVTKKLYEWVEKYFETFKEYILPVDVDKKAYLTCSISVLVYKIMCKELGVKEEYGENTAEIESDNDGGYVSYPCGEHFEEDIVAFDFASMYPHNIMQCNLLSPAKEGWHGGKTFKVKGTYNNVEMGKVEKVINRIYTKRLEYKKLKDPREYTLKIVINTLYGLTDNPSFAVLYNSTGASDCTWLGRQFIKYARKRFSDAGYIIIYTDTDSIYLKDKFKDKAKLLALKDEIIKEIKSELPFPLPTFDLAIDAEIEHIWFFKGNSSASDEDEDLDEIDTFAKMLGFMKKNYIYLLKIMDKDGNDTGERKVVYKNLGVKKKSTSEVTRYIFREILIPKIKEEKKVKWSKSYFEQLIKEIVEKYPEKITTRYKVNKFETYKNASQLQAQIAKRYGPGIHFLVKNYKIGIGKGSKYCTLKEFKELGLKPTDIDYSSIWSELDYFIDKKEIETKNDWW